MSLEKAPEVDRHVLHEQKDQHVRSAIRIEADRELVREVANGFRVLRAKRQRWEVLARDPMREREVRELVALRRQPRSLLVRQHRVEHHQPLDCTWHRHRLSVAVVPFANGGVEPFVVDMKDPPPRAPASMG